MSSLPSTYSRYVLRGTGSFDVLKLEEGLSLPSPRLGEVLVRVKAVSLNNRDLQVRPFLPASPAATRRADLLLHLLHSPPARPLARPQIAQGVYPGAQDNVRDSQRAA